MLSLSVFGLLHRMMGLLPQTRFMWLLICRMLTRLYRFLLKMLRWLMISILWCLRIQITICLHVNSLCMIVPSLTTLWHPPQVISQTVRLPEKVSKANANTPLVTTSLRRSSRLNRDTEEIQYVRLPYAPKKRRQPLVPEPVEGQAKRKLSLNDLPQPDAEVPSPIPIQT